MTTIRSALDRVPELADWVRWGFITVPLVTVLGQADLLGWILVTIALVLSVPILWLSPEQGPPWLMTIIMPVTVAVCGAIWVLVPHGLTSVPIFSTTFFTVLRLSRVPIVLVVLIDCAFITVWPLRYHWPLGDALQLYGVLAVVVLLGVARRARLARMEQTELALARAQTAAEEHARAGALAERARIARELHDVLAHSLAGLALNLQGARLMLMRDQASPDAVAQIERAQELASEGLEEARKAVAALREDVVPAERAVADLLASYRLDTGARADLTVEGEPRELDAGIGAAVVRAVQEALANTRKHAPQADVEVRLAFAADEVELTVSDKQGRRPPQAPAAGYGLRGMSERAALLNGRLESGPVEDGWRIHLTVPT